MCPFQRQQFLHSLALRHIAPLTRLSLEGGSIPDAVCPVHEGTDDGSGRGPGATRDVDLSIPMRGE